MDYEIITPNNVLLSKKSLIKVVSRLSMAILGFTSTCLGGAEKFSLKKNHEKNLLTYNLWPFNSCHLICHKKRTNPLFWGWLVGWLVVSLWQINLCRLFNDKSIFIRITRSICTIKLSIRTLFDCQKQVKYKNTVRLPKTFIFQAIPFSQTAFFIKTINLRKP